MAKGRVFKSHDAVSTSGGGSSQKTRQHTTIGLWVEARNLDTGSDTLDVTLEGSRNGDHFTSIDRGAPQVDDVFARTASDFEESDTSGGVFTTYVVANNLAIEHVRANITALTDAAGGDLEVDSYIFLGGWTGRGKSFDEREDTPTRV